jgi:DNA-binding NarL/FixJ family response regulator
MIAVFSSGPWKPLGAEKSGLDSFRTPALTGREQATLHLLTKGFSNRNIAAQLGITEGTVKMHVSHLFDKLAVRSRAELIAQFLDHT